LFASNAMTKIDLKVMCTVLNKRKSWHVVVTENFDAALLFLASKDAHIPDDSGKELATLNDAYEHARRQPELDRNSSPTSATE